MATILIIEPDRPLAQSLVTFLKRERSHNALWCPDAQSAINSSETTRPDVVVMELQLGMYSGLDFLYEFRSYPEWSSVPVVILSVVPPSSISRIFFDELKIAGYRYKPETSLAAAAEAIETALNTTMSA